MKKTIAIIDAYLSLDKLPVDEGADKKARALKREIAGMRKDDKTVKETKALKSISRNLDRVISATRSESYDAALIDIKDKEKYERLMEELHYQELQEERERLREEKDVDLFSVARNQGEKEWEERCEESARMVDDVETYLRKAERDPLVRTIETRAKVKDPVSVDGIDEKVVKKKPERKVLSGTMVAEMDFKQLPFTGKWAKLMGKPSEDAKMLIYGKPGNGKSTFAFDFARYLSKTLKKRTLYIAAEEGFSATLKDKINRLDCMNDKLFFREEMPENKQELKQYDVVFIDSVNYIGLKPEELRELPDGVMYFYVFQTTKSGVFKGAQEYAHDVDVVLKAEKFKVSADKNRYGGDGEPMEIVTVNKPEEK